MRMDIFNKRVFLRKELIYNGDPVMRSVAFSCSRACVVKDKGLSPRRPLRQSTLGHLSLGAVPAPQTRAQRSLGRSLEARSHRLPVHSLARLSHCWPRQQNLGSTSSPPSSQQWRSGCSKFPLHHRPISLIGLWALGWSVYAGFCYQYLLRLRRCRIPGRSWRTTSWCQNRGTNVMFK